MCSVNDRNKTPFHLKNNPNPPKPKYYHFNTHQTISHNIEERVQISWPFIKMPRIKLNVLGKKKQKTYFSQKNNVFLLSSLEASDEGMHRWPLCRANVSAVVPDLPECAGETEVQYKSLPVGFLPFRGDLLQG